jgi:hypothetical protein
VVAVVPVVPAFETETDSEPSDSEQRFALETVLADKGYDSDDL